MSKKRKFKDSWLNEIDKTNNYIYLWARKKDNENVQCTLCSKSVNFSEMGIKALTQHSDSVIHKRNTNALPNEEKKTV